MPTHSDATILDVARKTVKHMLEIAFESFKTKDRVRLIARSLMGRFVIVDDEDYSDPPNVLVDLDLLLEFAKPPTQKLSNMIITELDPEADTSEHSWLGTLTREERTIWVHLAKLNAGVSVTFWCNKPSFLT